MNPNLNTQVAPASDESTEIDSRKSWIRWRLLPAFIADRIPHSKPESFHSRHGAAARRLLAIQSMINSRTTCATEIVNLLQVAWGDLFLAMTHAENATPPEKIDAAVLLAEDSPLRQIPGDPLVGLQNLLQHGTADSRWQMGHVELEDALNALYRAHRFLKRWYTSRFATNSEKNIRACATVAQLLSIALALGTVGWGVKQHLSRPNEDEGLHATYFSETKFKGHPFPDTERQLVFDWNTHSPIGTHKHKAFSAKWQGCIHVPREQMSLVATSTESPLKVFVDGKRVIALKKEKNGNARRSAGVLSKAPETTGLSATSETLTPGTHSIEIRGRRLKMPVQIKLQWQMKNGDVRPVASELLIPPGGNDTYTCPATHTPNATEKRNEGDRANS